MLSRLPRTHPPIHPLTLPLPTLHRPPTPFQAQQRMRDTPGRQEQKQAVLRELLAEEGIVRPSLPSAPLPLGPSLRSTGLHPATATVHGSQTYPAFLSFALDGAEEATTKLIFKTGEDLRQDQLVLQLIRLMDALLKGRGLDMRLTPFHALATGRQQGIVEFVPGAVSVADVVQASRRTRDAGNHNGGARPAPGGRRPPPSPILAFLQQHGPSPGAPLGLEPAVLDTYVRSLAGYCIITHLLGTWSNW